MPHQKEITIDNRFDDQYVKTTPDMGRFLLDSAVGEVVAELGGGVKTTPGSNAIDIIPPIPRENLTILGERLVRLANQQDSSPPPATYEVLKKINA